MRFEELKPEFVYYMPEVLQEGILYISEEFKTSIHLCACGECKMKTVLPFYSEVLDMGWHYTKENENITFRPSIGNWQFPCRSHYYITGNKIEWL